MGLPAEKIERPAFSCSAGEGVLEADKRPVDLVHLARQTGGDRALEEEVLQLFLRQSSSIIHKMKSDIDAQSIKASAHTLCGAARAVGAFDVATSAKSVEEHPDQEKSLQALVSEVNEACDYISSLLR